MSLSFEPVNPKPFLAGLVGKKVTIRLKWGDEYSGDLSSLDEYMNLRLAGTQEWKKGAVTGALGDVLIRCNNILYIREGVADAEPGGMDE